jgi:hypothetical protein
MPARRSTHLNRHKHLGIASLDKQRDNIVRVADSETKCLHTIDMCTVYGEHNVARENACERSGTRSGFDQHSRLNLRLLVLLRAERSHGESEAVTVLSGARCVGRHVGFRFTEGHD